MLAINRGMLTFWVYIYFDEKCSVWALFQMILTQISRLMLDEAFKLQLEGAATAKEVFKLISGREAGYRSLVASSRVVFAR